MYLSLASCQRLGANSMESGEHSSHVMGYARKAALAAGVAVGAIILAPTVLPFVGVGTADGAASLVDVMHDVGNGSGLAGTVNELLSEVPIFGDTIVKGGMPAALLVATVGVGGWLLGKFVEKREDGAHVKLGKMIRYASLATSALIALPSTLTAIGTGLSYIAGVLGGPELATQVISACKATLGVTGEASASGVGLTGIAATLPHLLTCGASLVPIGLAVNDGLQVEDVKTPPPYSLRIQVPEPIVPNQPVEATLSIINNATGKPLTPEELAVVHTKKLHLFVVDKSLKDYHHIHPEPTGKKGEFAFSFTPNTAHDYQCFAEYSTMKDGAAHRVEAALPLEKSRRVLPAITTSNVANQSGLQFEWSAQAPLRQGEDCMVNVSVRDAKGHIFTGLEPVMGAYAHLVGFSSNGGSMLHCHPLGREPQSNSERGVGTLQFHVSPEMAGATQFFLQIHKDGKDVFVPFGQYVAPAAKATERLQSEQKSQPAHAQSAGLAMG